MIQRRIEPDQLVDEVDTKVILYDQCPNARGFTCRLSKLTVNIVFRLELEERVVLNVLKRLKLLFGSVASKRSVFEFPFHL
jgi:hypothetical protein